MVQDLNLVFKMVQIIPTLFSKTEEEYVQRLKKVNLVNDFEDGWVQLDLMDNKFVSSFSVGLDIVEKYPLPFKKEAQLMVINPMEWFDGLFKLNVDRIIFPLEIAENIDNLLHKVKQRNIQVGLSLNPETDILKIEPYLNLLDGVLLMGVTPGKEGQTLSPDTSDKIRYIKDKGWNILVGVDGGVKDINARQLVDSGADYLAIGSYLFNGDIVKNYNRLMEIITAS